MYVGPSPTVCVEEIRLLPSAVQELRGEFPAGSWHRRLQESGLVGELAPQVATSAVGSSELPFQRWFRFKEAFTPAFVANVFSSLQRAPTHCLDPFGGSGTTSLTAHRLGVNSTTIEVNPFLADLIEAKLADYDPAALRHDWVQLLERVRTTPEVDWPVGYPPSFVEPGVKGRWIFDGALARRIGAYRQAISEVGSPLHCRLLRIVLASALIPVSNVVVSGKGRRYRSAPQGTRHITVEGLDRLIDERFRIVFRDIVRFRPTNSPHYTIIRGDARERVADSAIADVVLFSPPYPNSFDYTDIYNVELWALGYLASSEDNRRLRNATLRSHVQILRSFDRAHLDSATLDSTRLALREARAGLWNRHIPEMVDAYFDDLCAVLLSSASRLAEDGRIFVVIGDSRYAGVHVDAAQVVCELAPSLGLAVKRSTPVRVMRASPQQGGDYMLAETLVEFALTRGHP